MQQHIKHVVRVCFPIAYMSLAKALYDLLTNASVHSCALFVDARLFFDVALGFGTSIRWFCRTLQQTLPDIVCAHGRASGQVFQTIPLWSNAATFDGMPDDKQHWLVVEVMREVIIIRNGKQVEVQVVAEVEGTQAVHA